VVPRRASEAPPVQLFLALGALALAAAGARAQWRSDRNGFLMVAALVATVTPVLIYYLNFKYGASQLRHRLLVEREVRDRDYFFVWSYSSLGVWMGLASRASGVRLHAHAGRTRQHDARRLPALALTSPLLALALLPLALTGGMRRAPARRSPASGRATCCRARSPAQSSSPRRQRHLSALVCAARGGCAARRDRGGRVPPQHRLGSVAARASRARAGMRPRPVRACGARARAERTAAINASQDELDRMPQYEEFRDQKLFVHGDIRARIGPGIVTREQMMVLRMIRDSFPDRPWNSLPRCFDVDGAGRVHRPTGSRLEPRGAALRDVAGRGAHVGRGHRPRALARASGARYSGASRSSSARANWIDEPVAVDSAAVRDAGIVAGRGASGHG